MVSPAIRLTSTGRSDGPVGVDFTHRIGKTALEHRLVGIFKGVQDEDGKRVDVWNLRQQVSQPGAGVGQGGIHAPWSVMYVHADSDGERFARSLLDQKSGKLLLSTHEVVGPTKPHLRHRKILKQAKQVTANH